MEDMVEFIRRVGCELNDLCLTKMSEKTLSVMVERHIGEVSRVQSIFLDSLGENEQNISCAVGVVKKCFDELA